MKKFMSVIIIIIIITASIIGTFLYLSKESASTPSWEVGDYWVYNRTVSDNLTSGNGLGIYVKNITEFKGTSFYSVYGQTSRVFNGRYLSEQSLNPIELTDFQEGTFVQNDHFFNFPLYDGKSWSFQPENDTEYRYEVEYVKNISVVAGTFETYKISKFLGNQTKEIKYYSPEVKGVIKITVFRDDITGYQGIEGLELESFGNMAFERKINSVELNNKYNARLELWELKNSPISELVKEYRVHYTKDGHNLMGRFSESQKYYLDWIINNTSENEKILCWWDYGHEIQGYTGRDVIIDSPSERIWDTIIEPWSITKWSNDGDIMNMSRALVGTPDETIDIMEQYNATFLFVGARELVTSPQRTGIYFAPVRGANENIDDYYEVLVMTDRGEFPIDDVPEHATLEWYGYGEPYRIDFKDPFYDSMIYRARFGWRADDIGWEEDDGLPSLIGNMESIEIYPAWNLTSFQVAFRTAYWNPYNASEIQDHRDEWIAVNYSFAQEMDDLEWGLPDLSSRSNIFSGIIILEKISG